MTLFGVLRAETVWLLAPFPRPTPYLEASNYAVGGTGGFSNGLLPNPALVLGFFESRRKNQAHCSRLAGQAHRLHGQGWTLRAHLCSNLKHEINPGRWFFPVYIHSLSLRKLRRRFAVELSTVLRLVASGTWDLVGQGAMRVCRGTELHAHCDFAHRWESSGGWRN